MRGFGGFTFSVSERHGRKNAYFFSALYWYGLILGPRCVGLRCMVTYALVVAAVR